MSSEITFPAITALFAGFFAVVLVPLTLQVGLKRISAGIFFGDGSNEDLARRRAAQSNFVQYVPFALLLMAFAEMAGLPVWLLWTTGALLLIGRAFHAYCFLAGDGLGIMRAAGMVPTLLVFVVLGGALVYVFATVHA